MIENLKSELIGMYIEKLIKVVDDCFIRIDELIKINEQIFGNEGDYENIFVYYHHYKKYLIKIMNIKMISNKLLKAIKKILKLIFFEEIEETNKIIKEQELKVIDSTEKNEKVGDLSTKENIKLSRSFLRATIDPSDRNRELLEENIVQKNTFNERALSHGLLKEREKNKNDEKSEVRNNSFVNNNNIDNNNEDKNDNNDKINTSNNGYSSSNLSNISDNNNENDDNNKENEKNKKNQQNKEKKDEIILCNNLNISSEMKTGNLVVNIEDIKINDPNKTNNNIANDSSRKDSISRKSTRKKEKEKEKDKENTSLISEEEKSNSKLIDLSMKRQSISISQINASPELKEQITTNYKKCFNEINKYITNILEIDKNEDIQKIISDLNFYDKKHSFYSNIINDDDICSIITYALTSDQYLDSVKIDNKNGLNEIKSEFINNDFDDNGDNDLFCNTSLLYDRGKVKFSLGNLTEEKITQILENELLSNVNKKCIYEVSYNPYSLFNEVFEKKKKKDNKNNTSKINFFHFNQNLYLMNSEINNITTEIQKITKERFEEFNKKFNFTSVGTFEEERIQTSELKITAFYSKHFESLRILYCSSYFEFLHSIMKSQEWSSVTGGKSKAHFFKSWDERFVVKCLSEMEFQMFIDSCFHYFVHNNKYFFFKMPSSLVKVVGAYKIKIKSSKKSIIYCVIMENLNYLLNSKKTSLITYDLKGSSLNRYIKEKENGRVLMDTNFVEDFCGQPLVLDQKIYTLLLCAISNDTKICRTMGVIDYSLLCVIVDYNDDKNNDEEENEEYDNDIIFQKGDNEGKIKYIRLGVLDYFRKYTWDKQLETLGKTIMHKFAAPTVINPKKYDERFFKKLSDYFIGI